MRKSIASVYSGFISTSAITKIITFLCIFVAVYSLVIFRNLLYVPPVEVEVESASVSDTLDTSSLEWILDDLYAYDGELNKEILRIHSELFLDFVTIEMIQDQVEIELMES